jgi:diguanylate cyclase (GGDEF)-like protein/PAS domain S-box-containing protein
VIDASPVAIVYSDLDRKIMLWNPAAEHIYGYPEAEVIGRSVPMVPPDAGAAGTALYDRALKGEVIRSVEVQRLRKNGDRIDVCISAAPLFGPDGAVRGVAFVHEDMTARKQAEEQLRHFAHFDPLTGLANRRSMEEKLASLVSRAGARATVALLDLDGFKDVNDTLGHSTGDRLLIEVARRLDQVARGSGVEALVFRLGGDEFVAILPDCGEPLTVGEVIGEMLARLAEPFEVAEHVLHIGASAGLAIAPLHGASVDDLLSNADLALYQTKKEGGGSYRFFAPTLRAQAQSRRGLDAELRRAFANGDFELYYQPQVRLSDGAVTGAEALLRWRHRERGILAPGLFVDTLADNPIAPEVGRWIIRTACAQAAAWRAKARRLARIGVNLFPTQLRGLALIDDVERALRESNLAPEMLELEITENIALNHEEAAKPLRVLRQQGVKIAFDDFGTGYASLCCLTTFPVSRIKIDRSFIARIANSAQDAAVIRSLISMAKSLDLEVIAEGVETAAQAAFLRNERCEEAQGFLFGKPLSSEEFGAYLSVTRIAGAADDGAVEPAWAAQAAAG